MNLTHPSARAIPWVVSRNSLTFEREADCFAAGLMMPGGPIGPSQARSNGFLRVRL